MHGFPPNIQHSFALRGYRVVSGFSCYLLTTVATASIGRVLKILASLELKLLHGFSILAGWVGGCLAAATLSGLDLCDYKLEEVQTWHTYSYHGRVLQRHDGDIDCDRGLFNFWVLSSSTYCHDNTFNIFGTLKVTILWCFSDACRLWGCGICDTVFFCLQK